MTEAVEVEAGHVFAVGLGQAVVAIRTALAVGVEMLVLLVEADDMVGAGEHHAFHAMATGRFVDMEHAADVGAENFLLAVLDGGSFSAAARRLGRVPSAVSMAIAQLEAELDLLLFDRSTRKALPTAAALALEPQARQVICQLNLLDAQALQLHKGLEQRLSIAIAPELLPGRWSLPMVTLAEEFPGLEVEVRSATQVDAVCMLSAGRYGAVGGGLRATGNR